MPDTLLRIRLFIAVYEERSFTAAALRERSTQSGVTQHIKKLEEHFGVDLFLRASGGIVPTPAADIYYRSCLLVMRAHEQSRAELAGFRGGMTGHISVGLTPTLTRAALAPVLDRFVSEHPNVIVRITDAYSDIVVERVRAGLLDFAIVPGVTYGDGLHSEFFARSPEFLVCGSGTTLPVRHGRPVRLGSLGPLRLVMPTGMQSRRDLLDGYLEGVGIAIERRLEIDTALGTLAFVQQSGWVTIQPGITLIRNPAQDALIFCRIVDPPMHIDLFRIERARHPLSPAATKFCTMLQEQTLQMADEANRFGA